MKHCEHCEHCIPVENGTFIRWCNRFNYLVLKQDSFCVEGKLRVRPEKKGNDE